MPTNSTFNGVGFDWVWRGPRKEIHDLITHYVGEVVIYDEADLDALLGMVAPVKVTLCGTLKAFVDYWPPDPSHTLTMHLNDGFSAELHSAILVALDRKERDLANAGDRVGAAADGTVHQGTADFLLLS